MRNPASRSIGCARSATGGLARRSTTSSLSALGLTKTSGVGGALRMSEIGAGAFWYPCITAGEAEGCDCAQAVVVKSGESRQTAEIRRRRRRDCMVCASLVDLATPKFNGSLFVTIAFLLFFTTLTLPLLSPF